MTFIYQFKGIRYNEKLNPLDDLIIPPFDEINEEQKERYKKIKFNFVHFTLPDSYEYPKILADRFLKDGIFKIDDDSYYLMEIKYENKILKGIVAAVDLNGKIFPHEKTFDFPVKDRYNLLQNSGYDFEYVFFLTKKDLIYDDEKLLSFGTMDNKIYNLYKINLKNNDMGDLVIADGHHRFRAALHFHSNFNGYDKILGFIINVFDNNLILKNANKMVHDKLIDFDKIREYFDLSDHGLKFIYKDNIYYIIPKDNDLYKMPQIFWFNEILKLLNIDYNINNVITYFDNSCKKDMACFFPIPPKPQEVFDLAVNNVIFPQKSTYFLPKPASGLVFMKK
ncbi:MAG: DUF1015 family protein [Thermoplasmata archaeon]|jgi:uncharacterized protein (DUF1015 family)